MEAPNQFTHSASLNIKIIVLGAYSVGKTCLIRRYTRNTFSHQTNATIGADFYPKKVVNPLLNTSSSSTNIVTKKTPGVANNQDTEANTSTTAINNIPLITVQFWDTAGLEKCSPSSSHKNRCCLSSSLGECFYRYANGALLVYDATSFLSFLNLTIWYAELMKRNQDLPVVIVANKLDKLRCKVKDRLSQRVPQRDVLCVSGIGKITDKELEQKLIGNTRALISNVDNCSNSDNNGLKDNVRCDDDVNLEQFFEIVASNQNALPDRDVVLLWCQRRGLKHVDTSALEDVGVKSAMETVVLLSLKSLSIQQKKNHSFKKNPTSGTHKAHYDISSSWQEQQQQQSLASSPMLLVPSVNNKINLYERYKSVSEGKKSCCTQHRS